MLQRRRVWVWVLLASFLVAGTTALALTHAFEDDADTLRELRLVFDVVGLLQSQYVEEVSAMELISSYIRNGSIAGMLEESLDDRYTRYVEPDDYRRMNEQYQGSFGGIGIVVGLRDGRLVIVSPIEGTPGAAAGLRSGDHITAIDGRPTGSMSQDEAVGFMRGEIGTEVVLSIEREVDGEVEQFDVEIIRAEIDTPSIIEPLVIPPNETYDVLRDPVGYLAMTNFTQRTDEEFVKALEQLLDDNQVKGILLDLRQNPGGILQTAIRVANRFIREGPLLHIDERTKTDSYHANPNLWMGEVPPIVVLVDSYTASSAEILAGALKDRGAAIVVGETTFGKGLIQSVAPLHGGGALVFTTARYRTAGGNEIDGVGVEPDILVEWPIQERIDFYNEAEFDPETGIYPGDLQLRRALEVLQQLIDQRAGDRLSPAA